MPDIVKKYLDKIKEFWNKYNKKQKTIFISSVLPQKISFMSVWYWEVVEG